MDQRVKSKIYAIGIRGLKKQFIPKGSQFNTGRQKTEDRGQKKKMENKAKFGVSSLK